MEPFTWVLVCIVAATFLCMVAALFTLPRDDEDRRDELR